MEGDLRRTAINPLTNRKINVDGETHKELIDKGYNLTGDMYTTRELTESEIKLNDFVVKYGSMFSIPKHSVMNEHKEGKLRPTESQRRIAKIRILNSYKKRNEQKFNQILDDSEYKSLVDMSDNNPDLMTPFDKYALTQYNIKLEKYRNQLKSIDVSLDRANNDDSIENIDQQIDREFNRDFMLFCMGRGDNIQQQLDAVNNPANVVGEYACNMYSVPGVMEWIDTFVSVKIDALFILLKLDIKYPFMDDIFELMLYYKYVLRGEFNIHNEVSLGDFWDDMTYYSSQNPTMLIDNDIVKMKRRWNEISGLPTDRLTTHFEQLQYKSQLDEQTQIDDRFNMLGELLGGISDNTTPKIFGDNTIKLYQNMFSMYTGMLLSHLFVHDSTEDTTIDQILDLPENENRLRLMLELIGSNQQVISSERQERLFNQLMKDNLSSLNVLNADEALSNHILDNFVEKVIKPRRDIDMNINIAIETLTDNTGDLFVETKTFDLVDRLRYISILLSNMNINDTSVELIKTVSNDIENIFSDLDDISNSLRDDKYLGTFKITEDLKSLNGVRATIESILSIRDNKKSEVQKLFERTQEKIKQGHRNFKKIRDELQSVGVLLRDESNSLTLHKDVDFNIVNKLISSEKYRNEINAKSSKIARDISFNNTYLLRRLSLIDKESENIQTYMELTKPSYIDTDDILLTLSQDDEQMLSDLQNMFIDNIDVTGGIINETQHQNILKAVKLYQDVKETMIDTQVAMLYSNDYLRSFDIMKYELGSINDIFDEHENFRVVNENKLSRYLDKYNIILDIAENGNKMVSDLMADMKEYETTVNSLLSTLNDIDVSFEEYINDIIGNDEIPSFIDNIVVSSGFKNAADIYVEDILNIDSIFVKMGTNNIISRRLDSPDLKMKLNDTISRRDSIIFENIFSDITTDAIQLIPINPQHLQIKDLDVISENERVSLVKMSRDVTNIINDMDDIVSGSLLISEFDADDMSTVNKNVADVIDIVSTIEHDAIKDRQIEKLRNDVLPIYDQHIVQNNASIEEIIKDGISSIRIQNKAIVDENIKNRSDIEDMMLDIKITPNIGKKENIYKKLVTLYNKIKTRVISVKAYENDVTNLVGNIQDSIKITSVDDNIIETYTRLLSLTDMSDQGINVISKDTIDEGIKNVMDISEDFKQTLNEISDEILSYEEIIETLGDNIIQEKEDSNALDQIINIIQDIFLMTEAGDIMFDDTTLSDMIDDLHDKSIFNIDNDINFKYFK